VTNSTTDADTTLRVSRSYGAPRERVFNAWLNAETLRRFFGPKDVTIGELEIDPRVGGSYKVVMNTADGPWAVRGTYLDIRRPERIVFTWAWDEDDPALVNESQVTLEFFERDGKTDLVLTHERLRNAESRDGHTDGWTAILENLDEVLA